MIKKVLKLIFVLFTVFTAFSFWMSPRLGGLITIGKEKPDQSVEILHFEDEKSTDIKLSYPAIVDGENQKKLREEYQLDTIIQSCKSDFDQVVKIQSWVQSR